MLLVGKGPFLEIIDYENSKLLGKELVFESQAVHGVVCDVAREESGTLFIWGGRSICLISISIDFDQGESRINIAHHMKEVECKGWILDACFDNPGTGTSSKRAVSQVMLVTAHNELKCISLVAEYTSGVRAGDWLCSLAYGPRSMLYSAHMLWAENGHRLLIAAGTVFGDVLLWSYVFAKNEKPKVSLHYRFAGHEGSVFGVRISEQAGNGIVQRVMVSCSDDRTIRAWAISDMSVRKRLNETIDDAANIPATGSLGETDEDRSSVCLAVVMGHASRIWGLQFLHQGDDYWQVLSYGEDSTAQAWCMKPISCKDQAGPARKGCPFQLSHQATYTYHSGKSIWGMAVHPQTSGDSVVATGGADGRVATYGLRQHKELSCANRCSGQYTMEEIRVSLQPAPLADDSVSEDEAKSPTRILFDALRGHWKLSRNISSRKSTCPSGILEGTADLVQRIPTGESYQEEYLYSENGDFVTTAGLSMKATRRYVYRYSKATDIISVWFVKPDDGSSADYFFHDLDFQSPKSNNIEIANGNVKDPQASGHHLCNQDHYNAQYSFQWKGLETLHWQVTFNVIGPQKEYRAEATYTRDYQSAPTGFITEAMLTENHFPENFAGLNNNFFKPVKPDSFKIYSWVSHNDLLASTEQGNLLVGSLNTRRKGDDIDNEPFVYWEHVCFEPNLRSTCIATSFPALGIALLTGTEGTIYLYNRGRRKHQVVSKLQGKVGFLRAHLLSERWGKALPNHSDVKIVGVFATCLRSPQATAFFISLEKEKPCSILEEVLLSLPAGFIVTSSCFIDTKQMIVLGSRRGDVATYDLLDASRSPTGYIPTHCLSRVHEGDAVTVIEIVPTAISKSDSITTILTAGRDGKWKIHHIFYKRKGSRLHASLETIHVGVPPFGPNIEGLYIDTASSDLFLWGFRSKQFVVWNESKKMEVMSVDCGGGHRNWAFSLTGEGGNFVYTKASVCHLHSQTQASHQVVRYGGHGREIKAIAISPPVSINDDPEVRYVATGAEDTEIRIFDLADTDPSCLAIITKHTTGIQELRWSSDGQLLFSAAGCEEFFVWRLQPAPCVTVGVICEAQCPPMTEECDLRIMDFVLTEIHSERDASDTRYKRRYLLSMVCSDSSIHIFSYDPSIQEFSLLYQNSYTTYCLTHVARLQYGDRSASLCTTSTDGHIAFWTLPSAQVQVDTVANLSSVGQAYPKTSTHSIQVHQNSIKAFHCEPITPTETLIATSGDDGALAFTRILNPRDADSSAVELHHATLLIPSAHASAVTALAHLEGYQDEQDRLHLVFATVGNDQRLKLWHLDIDLEQEGVKGFQVKKTGDVYTSVADASSMEVCQDGNRLRWLVIAGIGMEKWGVGGEKLMRG